MSCHLGRQCILKGKCLMNFAKDDYTSKYFNLRAINWDVFCIMDTGIIFLWSQTTVAFYKHNQWVDKLTCRAKNLVFKFWEFCRICTTWSHMSGLFCRSRSIWSAALLWNEKQQIQLLADNVKKVAKLETDTITMLDSLGWGVTAVCICTNA